MLTIETTAVISNERILELRVPSQIKPGTHKIVVIIDEELPHKKHHHGSLPVHDVGKWPANISLRREDLYDDNEK